MKLYEFLTNFQGDYDFQLYNVKGCFKSDKLENMQKECNKSFCPIDGFNNCLWSKEVYSFKVYDNKTVCVLINE